MVAWEHEKPGTTPNQQAGECAAAKGAAGKNQRGGREVRERGALRKVLLKKSRR